MNPFTGDATVLAKALGNDGGIWKDLHGTIQSIRIFDRVEQTPKNQTQSFSLEIKTDESAVGGSGPKACTGIFRVEASWSFMELKSVTVKKLSLDCK